MCTKYALLQQVLIITSGAVKLASCICVMAVTHFYLFIFKYWLFSTHLFQSISFWEN